MTDLVERLRVAEDMPLDDDAAFRWYADITDEAADEIERLQAELAALKVERDHWKRRAFPYATPVVDAQEPVALVNQGMGGIEWLDHPLPDDTPLYAAPVTDSQDAALVKIGEIVLGSSDGAEVQDWDVEWKQSLLDNMNETLPEQRLAIYVKGEKP